MGAIRAAEAELVPGIHRAMMFASSEGYELAIVTNQPCIARRECTLDEYNELVEYIGQLLSGLDVRVFACFHIDDDRCECRKPRPGLLLRAIEALRVEPHDCWMIGDRHSDMQAAAAAGCKGVYVIDGQDGLPAPSGVLVACRSPEAIYMAVDADWRSCDEALAR